MLAISLIAFPPETPEAARYSFMATLDDKDYDNATRTHLSLNKDAPVPRAVAPQVGDRSHRAARDPHRARDRLCLKLPVKPF